MIYSLLHKLVYLTNTMEIELPDPDEIGLNVQNTEFARGGNLIDVMLNMTRFMAMTITSAAVLGLIVGASLYLQSYGKDPMIEKAKTTIKWSIWGMVMGLLSYGIVQVIINALNMVD